MRTGRMLPGTSGERSLGTPGSTEIVQDELRPDFQDQNLVEGNAEVPTRLEETPFQPFDELDLEHAALPHALGREQVQNTFAEGAAEPGFERCRETLLGPVDAVARDVLRRDPLEQ